MSIPTNRRKADVDLAFFRAARLQHDRLMNCADRIEAQGAVLNTPAERTAVIDPEHRTLLAGLARSMGVDPTGAEPCKQTT